MTKLAEIEIEKQIRFHANKDIVSRSFIGIYMYLLIWFALIIPNQFYLSAPYICLSATLLFSFFSVIRIVLIFYFESIYKRSPRLWEQLFSSLIWITALAWGVLCAIAMVMPVFSSISLVLLLSTAGLCGGGVASLVPSRSLTIGLIIGFLLPLIVTLIFFKSHEISILLVFIIFGLGLLFVTRVQYKEYWKGLNSIFLAKQQAEELKLLNTIDSLTGLKNRAFFDERFGLEIKKAARAQSSLTILLIDIDHFKIINDDYGHLAGDECLKQFSFMLKKQIKREVDVVARYGGEEFVVILHDTSKENAIKIAEKIRSEIELLVLNYKSQEIMVTVSIGISSSIPKIKESKEAFFEKADIALYQAKNGGRNQVVS